MTPIVSEKTESLNVWQMIPLQAQALYRYFYQLIWVTGDYINFVTDCLRLAFVKPFRAELFFKHLHFIANQSLFVLILTAVFTGVVFAIQIYYGFHIFHAEGYVGPSVAIAVVRELSPVLTGLVLTGRAGAAITAEIASMRVSEQVDALETMGISSKQYLVTPRLLAGTLALPVLTVLYDVLGNLAAYGVSVYSLGLDGAQYTNRVLRVVDSPDILHGVIKAAFFGLILTSICAYKGYNTRGGAEQVGKSTNAAVVLGMVLILFADFILTGLLPGAVESF